MLKLLRRLAEERSAQDLVEYALLSALLAISCIAAITNLTNNGIGHFFDVILAAVLAAAAA